MILIIVFAILVIGILGLVAYENGWFNHEWINDVMLIIGAVGTIVATLGIIGSGISFA